MLGNAQVAGLFPVVYCSDGFCDLTGFSRAEVMQRGCACSFLYGPDTSELVRQQIRKALDEHKEFKAELILYRKSGKAPWHQFTFSVTMLDRASILSLSLFFSLPIFQCTHPPFYPFLCLYLLSWAPPPLLVSASTRFQSPVSHIQKGEGSHPMSVCLTVVSDSHVCSPRSPKPCPE